MEKPKKENLLKENKLPKIKRRLWQRDEVKKSGTNLLFGKIDVSYNSRNVGNDMSLTLPIRQTASIFKQPVTIIKNHKGGRVRHDTKNGIQEKPKQLFWEKRLEGLTACNIIGEEYDKIDLPKGIKAVGPNVLVQTVLQSVATALHISHLPITGQPANEHILQTNTGAFLDPDQPLMRAIIINEDDVMQQEEKVSLARKRLEDALKI